MSENIKSGLLVAIAILTLTNTVILLSSNNEVSYNRTATTSSTVSPVNNAVTPPANNINEPAIIQEDLGPKTSIEFAEMEHDFGTIEQNSTNPKVFTFTNTGDAPLIIADVKGSCGCTVPEYPREPIAPGATGEIKVVYSPGKQVNQQSKTVTIKANTEPQSTVLRIKANVTPGEDAGDVNSAPLEIGS